MPESPLAPPRVSAPPIRLIPTRWALGGATNSERDSRARRSTLCGGAWANASGKFNCALRVPSQHLWRRPDGDG